MSESRQIQTAGGSTRRSFLCVFSAYNRALSRPPWLFKKRPSQTPRKAGKFNRDRRSLRSRRKKAPDANQVLWRRSRDSNSGDPLRPTRFPIVRPRPTRRLLQISRSFDYSSIIPYSEPFVKGFSEKNSVYPQKITPLCRIAFQAAPLCRPRRIQPNRRGRF